MPVDQWTAQLLQVGDDAPRQRLLAEYLSGSPPNCADELANSLKEEVIRCLRSDAGVALRAAECILDLAQLAGSPSQRALGLRMRAQAHLIGFGQLQEALSDYAQAINLYDMLGDRLGRAEVEITHVWALGMGGDYAGALEAGDFASQIFTAHFQWRSLATLHNNLAMIHQRFGHLPQALEALNYSAEIYHKLGPEGGPFLTNNGLNRAMILSDLGQYQASIRASQEALESAQQNQQAILITRATHNLGFTYYLLGHYQRALALFDQARQGWLADRRLQEVALCDLSVLECLLQLRRFPEVLDRCSQIRVFYERQNVPIEAAQVCLVEAAAYLETRRYAEASASLDRARDVFETVQDQHELTRVDLLRCELLAQQDDFEACLALAAVCAFRFRQDGYIPDEGRAWLAAGRAALSLEKPGMAQEHAAAGLAIAEEVQLPELLYQGYHLLGRLELERGRPQVAQGSFARAVDELERLGARTMVEHRPDFLQDEKKRRLYEETVSLCLAGDQPWEALAYVERARSRALKDLIDRHIDLRIRARQPGDEPLVMQLNQLRGEHNALQRRWLRLGEPPEPVERERLHALEGQIGELWHRLLLRNTAYTADAALLEGSKTLPDIELEPGCLLVEYYLLDEGLLAFLVGGRDGGGHSIEVLSLPGSSRQIAQLYHALLLNLDLVPHTPLERQLDLLPNLQGLLGQLYRLLLAPFADRLEAYPKLVIVPYGILHYLPFHALWDGRSYLLESHQVGYLPSASFSHLAESRPSVAPRPGKGSLLAVGHSYAGRLPFALAEAQAIASQVQGRLLLEEEATCEAVQRLAGEYPVLHFAAHGEFRSDNPLFSGLALADGWLTTLDIFNLQLNASLVALSACRTGRSRLGGGDELLGLMRACLSAGASSLLLAQWGADDQSTTDLMGVFYLRLWAGEEKAAALRQAQLLLLHGPASNGLPDDLDWEPRYAHPYYWAPFFLTGDRGKLWAEPESEKF